MLENLIYDRTEDNVTQLKELSKLRYQDMTDEEKQSWIDNLKGCYRYTDLNRVEEAVEYLKNKIIEYGWSINLQPTKIWTQYDYPNSSDMTRYLNNIKAIRDLNWVLSDTPNAPSNIKLGWSEANDIERILHDVELMLVNITETYLYCGEIFSGGDFL